MLENKEQMVVLAKSLDQVAYALHSFCLRTLEALGEPTAQKGATPTAETQTMPASAKVETTAKPNEIEPTVEASIEKPLTLLDVRSIATRKTREGHTEAIRALLEAFGVNKLSEVDPDHYALLKAELEALGNG